MANRVVTDILDRDVDLDLECLDRIYLNGPRRFDDRLDPTDDATVTTVSGFPGT